MSAPVPPFASDFASRLPALTTPLKVIAPAESMSRAPAVLTAPSAIASCSSIVMEPAPLTEASTLATAVSRSMPVVASAVSTSAVTSSLSSVPSCVIAPVPASSRTSPAAPALISVAWIPTPVRLMSFASASVRLRTSIAATWPPAVIVIEPSAVSTSVSTRVSCSSRVMEPAPLTVASTLAIAVSRSIPVAASATKRPAVDTSV